MDGAAKTARNAAGRHDTARRGPVFFTKPLFPRGASCARNPGFRLSSAWVCAASSPCLTGQTHTRGGKIRTALRSMKPRPLLILEPNEGHYEGRPFFVAILRVVLSALCYYGDMLFFVVLAMPFFLVWVYQARPHRVSHGASFLAPGSLARRRLLARVIIHHHVNAQYKWRT